MRVEHLDDRAALAQALMNCRPMLEQEFRQDVRARLSYGARIPDDSQAEAHILKFVTAACSEEGGLEELLNALLSQPEIGGFCDVLDLRCSQTVSWRLVLNLKRAIPPDKAVSIPKSDAIAIYEQALSYRADRNPKGHDELLYWIVDDLAKRLAADGRQPLIVFIAALKPRLDRSVHPGVEQWLADAGRHLSIAADQRPRHRGGDYEIPFLLIKVKEKQTPKDFDVSALLQRRKQESLGDWVAAGLEAVRACIASIAELALSKLVAEPAKMELLTIEVFLPDHLLAWDIERVLTGIAGFGANRPLGADLPVFVRSLSRVDDPRRALLPLGRWVRKWNNRPARLQEEHVFYARSDKELIQLYDRLEPKLAFVSTTGIDPSLCAQTVDSVLNSGVPIALWPHVGRPLDEEDRKRVLGILGGDDFDRVPLALSRSRKEALTRQTPCSLFEQMMLLWDDPTRIPKDSRVAMMNPES